jgi:tetratricopeptide (TPR) repeat protein
MRFVLLLHSMRTYLFIGLFCFVVPASLSAQVQEISELQETARQFMRSGDWNNAVLVLNKAITVDPQNIQVQKDLALTYYYQRDYVKSKAIIQPLVDREDADVQVFQIAGNLHKALQEIKECEKLYKKGLKKYPESGPLYAEYGELLWMTKDNNCIQQWEQGIKADPSYAANYYHAARFYSLTKDIVWALLYGEIFLNMESYTNRTAEMKSLLLETYKRIFLQNADQLKQIKGQGEFSHSVLNILFKNSSTINKGITTESLVMLRTRFLLDWYHENKDRFPFRLFEHQRQLLQEGLFEAYNYWIFEAPSNLASFENWTKTHAESYTEFTRFQKSKIFKVPQGQYYKTK